MSADILSKTGTKFCRFRDAMLESINEGDFDDKIHESNIEGDYCEPEYREHLIYK
jgi:hypothetical protein